MVSNRCKIAVKEELKKLGFHFIVVDLGEVEIMEELTQSQLSDLRRVLLVEGFELMDDRKSIVIEQVKNLIVELIHHSEEWPNVSYSNYISEKLNYDYTYLSGLFSEVKGITIQQFIISHKIEKVKELLLYDELTLTEISYRMHYSSVSHLSNQFKKETGLTPTHFKAMKDRKRIPLEDIGH